MALHPLFVPSGCAEIGRALDLAALRKGERFVDLGCGDGRVLVEAARRGAAVLGVELDPVLARVARAGLAQAGLDGRVEEGDMLASGFAAFAADVVFTFLSAGMLQKLSERLASLPPGMRIVTVGPCIPGWQPVERAGTIALYVVPSEPAPLGPVGWSVAGLGILLRCDRPSLTSFRVTHGVGPIEIQVSRELRAMLRVETGSAALAEPANLGVDLYWRAQPKGTAAEGRLQSPQLGELRIAVFYVNEPPFGLVDFNLLAVPRG